MKFNAKLKFLNALTVCKYRAKLLGINAHFILRKSLHRSLFALYRYKYRLELLGWNCAHFIIAKPLLALYLYRYKNRLLPWKWEEDDEGHDLDELISGYILITFYRYKYRLVKFILKMLGWQKSYYADAIIGNALKQINTLVFEQCKTIVQEWACGNGQRMLELCDERIAKFKPSVDFFNIQFCNELDEAGVEKNTSYKIIQDVFSDLHLIICEESRPDDLDDWQDNDNHQAQGILGMRFE